MVIAFVTMSEQQQENSNLADEFIRDATAATAAADNASRASTLSWEKVPQPQSTNVADVQVDPWHGQVLPQDKYQQPPNVTTENPWNDWNNWKNWNEQSQARHDNAS